MVSILTSAWLLDLLALRLNFLMAVPSIISPHTISSTLFPMSF